MNLWIPHQKKEGTGHTIQHYFSACGVPKKTVRLLLEQAARIAISCSYRIFNSRASCE